MSLLEPSFCWVRGQHQGDRYRRGLLGPAGVLEHGRGMGWIVKEPEKSCSVRVRKAGWGMPASKCPRPEKTTSGLTGARKRYTNREKKRGSWKRNHKQPVCSAGWRSVSVVSAKPGNQIDGTRRREGRRHRRELLTGNMGGDTEPYKPVHETAADSGTGEEQARCGAVLVESRHRPRMDAGGLSADPQEWCARHRRGRCCGVRIEP